MIKGRPALNKQQVFDVVARHLLTQNARCSSHGECLYRYDGMKCAIGRLIPDELYDPVVEGAGVIYGSIAKKDNSEKLWAMLPVRRTETMSVLLNELQKVHDDNDPEDWRQLLSDVAGDFGLKQEALNE